MTKEQLITYAVEYLDDSEYEVHVTAGKIYREPKKKPPTLREFFYIWLPERLSIKPDKRLAFVADCRKLWEDCNDMREYIQNLFIARIERMLPAKDIYLNNINEFNFGKKETAGLLPQMFQIKINGDDSDNDSGSED